MVVHSPYVVHHRSDLHRDADRFLPDRWRRRADGTTRVPPEGFLAFGSGPTRCVGETFGLTEAVPALASIAARWDLVPVPGRARALSRSVLSPHGPCTCGCACADRPPSAPVGPVRDRLCPDRCSP
ncbi:hypothetical protein GCM10018793_25980 [Streptomyces sulfonofaciens]|uniref:Cytochrome P450 n=2 Tax=Streptomyces sulfonofaciens TaxID=68272 RepID=A0A919KY42_9ACTN|nr:hypothetical protein GCM10018793_25980 [Streptomyces sulfonofaciens]